MIAIKVGNPFLPPFFTRNCLRSGRKTLTPFFKREKLSFNHHIIDNYGADHIELSQAHLNRCADKGIFVHVLPLRMPIPMYLDIGSVSDDDYGIVLAKSKPRISTTLYLSSGPFRICNMKYLCFPDPMDEFTLSCSILQTIGFGLDRDLAAVCEKYHDIDFYTPHSRPLFSTFLKRCHRPYLVAWRN